MFLTDVNFKGDKLRYLHISSTKVPELSFLFPLFRVSGQPTAADVVNSLDETDLAKIIRKYGEETRAKKIAHGIVQARSAFGRINTTKELATVVESCAG